MVSASATARRSGSAASAASCAALYSPAGSTPSMISAGEAPVSFPRAIASTLAVSHWLNCTFSSRRARGGA